jgi:CheY-like chemotaxis protein
MIERQLRQPILLVEDNDMDLDLALRAFKRGHGRHPIELARDGQEALEWLRRWQMGAADLPLLVLLDLNLPEVDGLTVLRHFKNHPQFAQIPVVVLTTSAEDRDVRQAYQLGANSYIVKPVDFDKFMEVTRQIELYWTVLNKLPAHSGAATHFSDERTAATDDEE